MNSKVYLDYAATTPVDPRVVDAMLPYFKEIFGNPSSIHGYGQQAERAVEDSRQKIAVLIDAQPDEFVFTACGTESDNLALAGVAFARREAVGADHVLISPVEHHAVLHTAEILHQRHGFRLEYLPVDDYGRVQLSALDGLIRDTTALVSVIHANNEIGTLNPIAEIGAVCRRKGVPLHTDSVQAAAHLLIDVERDQIDLMSIGAHKFYGPKGVGGLFVRKGIPITPIQFGGGQEYGLRAGTQNVPYIVGMAEALRIAQHGVQERGHGLSLLRDELIRSVVERIPGTFLTGHPVERLPNHASFVFEGVDGNDLLMRLDMAGFACSSGSACKVGVPKPSEVLTAIGLAPELALGSLRVTLGKDTTQQEVESFLSALPVLIQQTRDARG